LLAAIQALLGAKQPKKVESGMSTLQTLHISEGKLHILLTEDNPINQRLAVRVLEKRGHTVEVAVNGKQAVDLLAEKLFDVVLMDVQMPEMNGFDATAIIRHREQATGAHTPIIAMTAYAMKGDRERCLAAGMDAYVSKPLQIEELLQAIERLVSGSTTVEAEMSAAAATVAGFDFSAFIARADGDIELAHKLVEIFLGDCPHLLSVIREAVNCGDSKALECAAHSLKGVVGYFSNGRTAEMVLQLEAMGESNNLSGAQHALSELETAMNQLTADLAALKLEYT
jgi:CheY-like chemotaxis protein/HPt (histidine-containing phosphotransfer) domain-containing protein